MHRFVSVALLAALLAGCGKKPEEPKGDGPTPGKSDPPKGKTDPPKPQLSDKERMQGVWVGVSFESVKGTKEMSGDKAARFQVVGDVLALRESVTDDGERFNTTWDDKANPKQLVLQPLDAWGEVMKERAPKKSIYKFEGDVLVIGEGARGDAPADFKPTEANGAVVLRFKKSDEKPVDARKVPKFPK
jgi:uncharacterized protein (TIGR03067 family)